MSKISTFALTFRPRNGVSDIQILQLEQFILKRSQWWHLITEKLNDERHVHAGFVTKAPMTRSNLCQCLTQLFPELSDDERRLLFKGVKVMYNKDFIENYLNKDDDTVVISTNLPEAGSLESYFPPKPKAPANRRLAYHALMEQYEVLWRQHRALHVELNTMNVRDFLHDMQYNERLIGLLPEKTFVQHSKWLTRWMNPDSKCTYELPCFEKEEGPGFH